MTFMNPYFLISVSAGLKLLYPKVTYFYGNKDVYGIGSLKHMEIVVLHMCYIATIIPLWTYWIRKFLYSGAQNSEFFTNADIFAWIRFCSNEL